VGVLAADCGVGPTALTNWLLSCGESKTDAVNVLVDCQKVHTAIRLPVVGFDVNAMAQVVPEQPNSV
jgi:hypothetical protein